MNTSPIANAAAELDREIKIRREHVRACEEELRVQKTELHQLVAARSGLDPFVHGSVSDGSKDLAHSDSGLKTDKPRIESVDVDGETIAIEFVDATEVLGPSDLVERIFLANADREMSFADIEDELAKVNVTRFSRDQVRGAVYYGKRTGWAEQARRGRWRLKDNSTPVASGVESRELEAPNFEHERRNQGADLSDNG